MELVARTEPRIGLPRLTLVEKELEMRLRKKAWTAFGFLIKELLRNRNFVKAARNKEVNEEMDILDNTLNQQYDKCDIPMTEQSDQRRLLLSKLSAESEEDIERIMKARGGDGTNG